VDLLIDGKNCAYRAVFASRSSLDHPVTVMIRFIGSYIERFAPSGIHVFWEGASKQLWRKSFLSTYKDNRHQDHDFDVEEVMRTTQIAAINVFTWLNCRQYYRPAMEADDLIYAFCRSQMDKALIISSDGDFRQLCHLFRDVSLYDPMKSTSYERGIIDPLELKCFCGDKSDNISGYRGIGPVKAKILASDLKAQQDFFAARGKDIYLQNRRLIDLTMCPFIGDNVLYVRSVLATKVPKFDKVKVLAAVQKNKVVGLTSELGMRERQFLSVGKGW